MCKNEHKLNEQGTCIKNEVEEKDLANCEANEDNKNMDTNCKMTNCKGRCVECNLHFLIDK